MSRITLLALVVLLACGRHLQNPPSAAPTLAEIRAVIETYDAAWNRRDGATVAALLASDYVYFSSRGRLTPRGETLAFLASPAYVLVAAERTELQATHIASEVAVVSSRWRGHGTWQGAAFRDDQRCSIVLGRGAGRWQVLAEHCTQITQP